jgi:hypothetical protein
MGRTGKLFEAFLADNPHLEERSAVLGQLNEREYAAFRMEFVCVMGAWMKRKRPPHKLSHAEQECLIVHMGNRAASYLWHKRNGG